MEKGQHIDPERSRLTLLLGLSASAASAGCTVGGKPLSNQEQLQIWAERDTRKVQASRKRTAYIKSLSRKKPAAQPLGGEGEGHGD